VAAELAASGVAVSRASLAPALRQRGVSISTTGVGQLVKALKSTGRAEGRKARRTTNVKRTRTAAGE
jgi:hypothetical protein